MWLPVLGLAQGGFSAWKDSTRIYINTSLTGANVTASVGKFPLLVRLDSSNFDFTKAQASGADLRFADPDRTPLVHEIELFDAPGRKAALWVRVPKVDSLSTSDHIIMYWNNPAAASATGAVFDTALGYAGVWHFGEDAAGTGTKGLYKDATRNANHGDDYVSDPRKASVIGFGQEFDGVDDRISIPNSATLALPGPISISAWVKADWLAASSSTEPVVNAIVRKGDDNPNSYQLAAYNKKVAFILDTDDGGGIRSKTDLVTGTFYHVAGTWVGNDIKIYVNGVLEFHGTTPSSSGALSKDSRPMHIGGRVMTTDPNTQDRWDGHIDEVRLSSVAHTSQHYKLSYETQKPGSGVLTFQRFPAPVLPAVKIADWTHSRKIVLNTTSEGAGVSGAVTAFPLLVRLNAELFPFGEAKAGGADLRFTDPDGVFLPYSIERWDGTAKKAEVWVRVPKVDGNSGTDYIRMHWGNALAMEDENPTAVFDTANGFTGVWHLNEQSPGKPETPAYKDQTANKNHGHDLVAADASEALIGRGQRFGAAGAQDYISVPANDGLDFQTAFTFSAWVRGAVWDSGSPRVSPIIRKGGGNPNAYQFAVDSGHANLYVNDRDENGTRSGSRLDTGSWYHVAATWRIGAVEIFVNGTLSRSVPSGGVPPVKDGRPFFIGGRDTTGGGGDQLDGTLDEVQVSKVIRSADWIKLSYESQKANTRLLWHEGLEGKLPPKDTVVVVIPPKDTVKPPDPVRPAWTWDTTLAPGAEFGQYGVFRIHNPSLSFVRVVISPAGDTAGPGVIGVEAIFRFSATGADGQTPIITLTMDTSAAAGRSVYQLLPGTDGHGRLGDWGAAAGSTDIYYPGSYIVAKDTTTPRIKVVEEGVGETDSSWIRMVIEDNIKHVFLKCFSTGAEGSSGASRREGSGVPFRYAFKPLQGTAPLKIFVSVDDGRHQAAFPPPPASAYVLPRSLPDLSIPVTSGEPLSWSLFGLPVRPAQAATLESLAKASGAGRLRAAVWKTSADDSVKGEYVLLEGQDTLPAGVGLWLAGESRFTSLPVGSSRSLSQPSGTGYALSLRRGWNQITSPALESLPWVVDKADLPTYDQSPVKGLHAWLGEGRYRDADTLEPFRGYFVYSRAETTLVLSPDGAAAAKSAMRKPAAPHSLAVLLDPVADADGGLPAAATFRLGAAAYAGDGIGMEDEPMPSSPARNVGMAASRAGRSLRSDIVGYRAGGIHAWKLAWTGREDTKRREETKRRTEGRLRVSGLQLPAGMILRAASASAPEPSVLAPGSEVALSALPGDTLVLWAAPPGAWSPGDPIPELSPRPLRLAAAFHPGPGGADLEIALPEATGLRAAVHTADGRRWAFLERARLAPGRHAFRLGHTLPRGLLIVTLEFPGATGTRRLVLKSVHP